MANKIAQELMWKEWIEEVSDFLAEGKGDAIPMRLRKVLPKLIVEEVESLGYVQKAKGQPTIICLCGSGRFKEAFERAEFDNTLKGKIVLTIGCNTHDVAHTKELAYHKSMLDELHLRKIDLADEVMILNVGGYIGESTRNELNYAISKGKKVTYLEGI